MWNGSKPFMLNIGFMISPSSDWLGGLNYYKNLFFAINRSCKNNVQLFVFVSKNIDSSIINEVVGSLSAIKLVKTPLLTKYSFPWFIWRITKKTLKSDFIVYVYLRKYKIDIYSHCALKTNRFVKTLNWIPDFQHLYYPEYFPGKKLLERELQIRDVCRHSTAILLSSYNSQNDLNTYYQKYAKKSYVLPFVSQMPSSFYDLNLTERELIVAKYSKGRKFIYLPNQFWQHKNHIIVFKAVSLLKKEGTIVDLICSGSYLDHRNNEYMDLIWNTLDIFDIKDCVNLVGIIPYKDVCTLIKHSLCVINPSLFEGWSSTVEECKSINKTMIISDIPVHRQQYPEALFFDPNNFYDLAKLLEKVLDSTEDINPDMNAIKADLDTRTNAFGLKYLEIVRSII